MADGELTMPDLDPDRHYGALLGGGENNQIRVRVKCGSTQEVSVSQIGGGFVMVSEEVRPHKPGSTEEERMSSCGWVLRCSWDNGFVRITSEPQGAPIRCYQRATPTG